MSGTRALPPEVLEEIKAGFFEECMDMLGQLETGLLALKQGERDPEIVNTVFRAAHSIKGGGASFGLGPLVHFAHRMESVLAAIRSERLSLDVGVIGLLLKAVDILADHVRAARDGGVILAEAPSAIEQALIDLVNSDVTHSEQSDREPPFEDAFEPIAVDVETGDPETAPERNWIIRFRPHASLYASANEPLILLRELKRLGSSHVTLDDGELPPVQDLNPEDAYLLWTVSLKSTHDEQAIRSVFEFVESDCDIEILSREQDSSRPARGQEPRNGKESPASPASEPKARAPAGPVAATGSMAPSRLSDTIRVDLERIDRLINLASELVINQAMLTQRLSGSGVATAVQAELPLDELNHLTRELQDSVMAIRSQPVKVVFQRLSRLVREVEAMTGKQVNLVTEGEATEVDRTVVEHLIDPLTHIVRNAIDHGIETPEERLAAGKPVQGRIRISAAHRGGRIVIEAADDGRGIDRARVREVASARGLISADAELSESDVDNLIFLPGFSTAETVSEISGRGVGMDVVKKGVESLGGRVSIQSNPGIGTTFVLSLPLTLAVLDGMQVSVCGHSLIAPLTTLLETIQPKPGEIRSLGPHASLMSVRGEHVPVIDLGRALDYRTEVQSPRGIVLLVENDAGRRAGLLVDEVLGQRQVVIKSIQTNYCAVDGIAAATILGDGRVALILDVNAILLSHGSRLAPAERPVAAG